MWINSSKVSDIKDGNINKLKRMVFGLKLTIAYRHRCIDGISRIPNPNYTIFATANEARPVGFPCKTLDLIWMHQGHDRFSLVQINNMDFIPTCNTENLLV